MWFFCQVLMLLFYNIHTTSLTFVTWRYVINRIISMPSPPRMSIFFTSSLYLVSRVPYIVQSLRPSRYWFSTPFALIQTFAYMRISAFKDCVGFVAFERMPFQHCVTHIEVLKQPLLFIFCLFWKITTQVKTNTVSRVSTHLWAKHVISDQECDDFLVVTQQHVSTSTNLSDDLQKQRTTILDVAVHGDWLMKFPRSNSIGCT